MEDLFAETDVQKKEILEVRSSAEEEVIGCCFKFR